MRKGVFCISIDLELLWGRKDLSNRNNFIPKIKKEREIIKKLLKLFKKYKIPVTWAVVGKLYEKGDKLWSGVDIIKWIKKESIHELASHSYSHEIFNKISSGKAYKELQKSKARSFVFPQNKIKHLSLLKKNKFTNFREKDKSEYELLIPRIPPTGKPKMNIGLVQIPSSMYFVSDRGTRKYIPKGLRYLKSKLGIDKAINNSEIFHLWFHPVDFADNTNSLMDEFENILKYANSQRRSGKLEILTMENIAKGFIKSQ